MNIDTSVVRDTKYESITLGNFEDLPQVKKLPPDVRQAIKVVGNVLPFKSNNYVVNRLINWDDAVNDPIFILTFMQRDMLENDSYKEMEALLEKGGTPAEIKVLADKIRMTLNPHPAGQMQHNLPVHHDEHIDGMQHKYKETILFFPNQGQTCHAYCTFCFRWAQFVGMKGLKFATRDAELLAQYLKEHPYTTDVLFTGGDPMIMKTKFLKAYIEEMLKVPTLRTIRIGTKALAFWPQRFLTDDDAPELLEVLKKAVDMGKHVAIMAHFNHWVEFTTPEVLAGIEALKSTGAVIRTQSPILKNINDSSDVWAKMWQLAVETGTIPYYMFVARDTGAKRYFEVPLARAYEVFRGAFRQVSGLARTVRGPSMSCSPGKIRILGISDINGEKVFVLDFLQGRNPDWVGRPFFAKFDSKAVWFNDLKPAFGEKEFFFEAELKKIYEEDKGWAPDLVEA